MVNPAIKVAAKKSGGFLGRTFGRLFRFRILMIFMLILITNSLILGLQAGSFQPIIEDLGPRLITPTIELGEFGQEVLDNKGYWESGKTLTNIWDLILMLTNIYVFLFWVAAFAFLVGISPFSNRVEAFKNWSLGLFLFLIVQVIYLMYTQQKWYMPFSSLWIFAKSLPYIFQPAVDLAEKVIQKGNFTNSTNSSRIIP